MNGKEHRERTSQGPLPELTSFKEPAIEPGEALDLALATTTSPIRLFTTPEGLLAGDAYRAVIGKDNQDFALSLVENPMQEASQVENSEVVPLVMHSATDQDLNHKMYADGPVFGQFLMSHLYFPSPNHESPALHVVGISHQGLGLLGGSQAPTDKSLIQQLHERRQEILGETLSNEDFRQILQSDSVLKIIAHTLGPVGTNISQAMQEYLNTLGVRDKTDLVIHLAGIDPMMYAELAREEVSESVVPLHMEYAVYYEMAKLFNARRDEVVFADHHYMPLDAMQLASVQPIEELTQDRAIKIATHPSAQPLIMPWVKAKRAEWTKAASNPAAAQMVLNGEVDACVTTGSSLHDAPELAPRHIFGSPVMLFTIGTSLNQQQLQELRNF